MTRRSHVRFAMRGLPKAASPLLMSLLVMLPSHAMPTLYSENCHCATPVPRNDAVVLLEEHLSGETTNGKKLNCCGRHLLAAHDTHYGQNDSFSIVWSFKGKEYKVVDGVEKKWPSRVSTFEAAHCGLQTLESDNLVLNDEGVYSCRVTSSGGTSITKNFSLCLNVNSDTGSPPFDWDSSKDIPALLRRTVTFSCSAHVGQIRCGRIKDYRLVWNKERRDGSWMEASELPYIEIATSGVENGAMKSLVTIHSVQTQHFGRYRCTVTNHNGNFTHDITLRKGVSPIQQETGEYRAALFVLVVAAFVFLGTAVLFRRRCHVAFSLHFRQKKTGLLAADYQHDVFLVHGESASSWVWSILLPALENSFGYTCFLPQRDMRGGSMIIEEVAEMVYGCRSLVVVITPCLLENPWAAWALHNAMKAALEARTRLLALRLQDLETRTGHSNTGVIVDVLKHIRNIPVPRSCRMEDSKPKEDPIPNNLHKKETQNHKSNCSLKALKVDTMVCRSRSKSPKNQKLSNMITGDNISSIDTKEQKKKHRSRSPVIVLERDDSEEPSSPCSETPFILPSSASVLKNKTTLVTVKKKPSLWTFLSVLCAGDQQELFWHTLLAWLGPPSTTKPREHGLATTHSV